MKLDFILTVIYKIGKQLGVGPNQFSIIPDWSQIIHQEYQNSMEYLQTCEQESFIVNGIGKAEKGKNGGMFNFNFFENI